jgi:hypothetical protein
VLEQIFSAHGTPLKGAEAANTLRGNERSISTFTTLCFFVLATDRANQIGTCVFYRRDNLQFRLQPPLCQVLAQNLAKYFLI